MSNFFYLFWSSRCMWTEEFPALRHIHLIFSSTFWLQILKRENKDFLLLTHFRDTELIWFLSHLLVAWSPKVQGNSQPPAMGSTQVMKGLGLHLYPSWPWQLAYMCSYFLFWLLYACFRFFLSFSLIWQIANPSCFLICVWIFCWFPLSFCCFSIAKSLSSWLK